MVPPNGTEDEDHGDLDYVNPSSFFFMLKNLLYIYIGKSFIFLFFKINYKFHSLTLSIFILQKKQKKKTLLISLRRQ